MRVGGSRAELRVINTLRDWGVYVHIAFFLGGVDKGSVLEAFNPHIFFDDQDVHVESASGRVPTGKVLYPSDSTLRALQENLGLRKTGTIGIPLRAQRKELIEQFRPGPRRGGRRGRRRNQPGTSRTQIAIRRLAKPMLLWTALHFVQRRGRGHPREGWGLRRQHQGLHCLA